MSRIFLGLASLNGFALLLTFTYGILSGDREQTPQTFTVHLLAGLFAAFFTLFVHSIAFTYMIGTGRWVQEVVAAYQMSESFGNQSRQLKLHALPFILGSMLLVIGTAVAGAASDRGWLDKSYHSLLAMAAIAFNFWSYIREYRMLSANGTLIARIMEEVIRMRKERGLPCDVERTPVG